MNSARMLYLSGAVAVVAGAAMIRAGAEPRAGLFPYDNADAVARGAVLYADYCASCHGSNLEGQADWRVPGPNGRLPAPPHDETGHTWHHPDAQLFDIVKWGTAAIVGNGYESDMAGYDGLLSDTEIKEVMAYIKSTWPDHIISRHDEMNARMTVSQ